MNRFTVRSTGLVAAALVVPLLAPAAAHAATRTVTITAASKITTYGAADPAYTFTVSGLAAGDSLTTKPTCTAAAHSGVGRFAITCAGAKAASKYTIAYRAGTLYVGQATITVAASYRYKYYGDADPAFGYAVTGLVGKDKVITAPSCGVDGPHADAGRYEIDCSGGDAGPNYVFQYFANAFDVAKSPVLVGPDAQYLVYGSAEPDFTYETFGLKNDDELVTEPTCGVAGEHVHPGVYTITCTGADAGPNYQLATVTGKLTVVKAPSGIKAEPAVLKRNLLGVYSLQSGKLTATLVAAMPEVTRLPDQTLTFTAGGTTLCTGVTNAQGVATCSPGSHLSALVKNGGYTVAYAGTTDIGDSSATAKNVQ